VLIVPRVSGPVQLSIPTEVSSCSSVRTGEFRCVHLALSGGGPGRSARRPGTEMGAIGERAREAGLERPIHPR
jgi:hypothetical protein